MVVTFAKVSGDVRSTMCTNAVGLRTLLTAVPVVSMLTIACKVVRLRWRGYWLNVKPFGGYTADRGLLYALVSKILLCGCAW